MGLQLTADNTKGNNVNTYHLTETVRVAAPERRNQNLTDVERQYLDSMEITAIGHDDRETSAAVDIPAAAVGMVAGIPTPTVSVG